MDRKDFEEYEGKDVKLTIQNRFYSGNIKKLNSDSLLFYDFKLKTNLGVVYKIIDMVIPLGLGGGV